MVWYDAKCPFKTCYTACSDATTRLAVSQRGAPVGDMDWNPHLHAGNAKD